MIFMIQHIKLLSIFICLTLVFTTSCKENKTRIDKINKQNIIAKQKNTTYNWQFLNAFTLDNSMNEISNSKFENLKFKITKDSIFIENIGKEAIYSGKSNTKKYFNSIYDYVYLKRFLSEKFNIKIENSINHIRNKHIYEKNTILKSYFGDAFIIDNLLFLMSEENIIVYTNSLNDKKESVRDRTETNINDTHKVNSLPIMFDYSNDFRQIQLPVSWANIKTSFEDSYIALLPKIKKFQPVILTGIYPAGNSEEFLLILNSDNKEISRIKLYYNDAPDGNIENYSYSTYKIGKDYTIKITTYKVKEDLEKNKITEKKSSDIYYIINNKGMIIKK